MRYLATTLALAFAAAPLLAQDHAVPRGGGSSGGGSSSGGAGHSSSSRLVVLRQLGLLVLGKRRFERLLVLGVGR